MNGSLETPAVTVQPKLAGSGSRGLAAAAASMSGITAASILLAFITAPLQGRALGPSGRGDLAAIGVVLGVAPSILDLGLGAFVARERARGVDRGSLFGTILALGGVISVIGMAAAVPVGHLIGHGRPAVTRYVEIVLWLSPIYVAAQTLGLTMVAERRWNLVNRLRLTPPLVTSIAVVALFILGQLTVSTAALIIVGAGLLSSSQLLPVVWRVRGWTVRRSLIRPGLRYGTQAWVATILTQGNSYLDQLLMTGLTSARQLGLYAVATTVSSVALPVIAAPLGAARFADVAAGDHNVVPSLCRTGVLGTFALAMLIAVAGPVVIVLLFGSKFGASVPMLWILLISSLPAAIAALLIQMLAAAGHPAAGTRAQAVGLAVTIPILILALRPFGGLGASVVDVVTNAVVASVAVRYARRTFGGRAHDYWIPRRADVTRLVAHASRGARTLLGMLRAAGP